MTDTPLTGAQKTYLRGQGQKLEATLKVGQGGLTPAFLTEFANQIRRTELIKIRLVGFERDKREVLVGEIALQAHAALISAVGHTAVFYKENPALTLRSIVFPD